MTNAAAQPSRRADPFREERLELACAVRWAARFNWHEAVANHFSLSVNEDGTHFYLNPRHRHFARVSASDFLLLDVNESRTMARADAPYVMAWGLHGSVHRRCSHALRPCNVRIEANDQSRPRSARRDLAGRR